MKKMILAAIAVFMMAGTAVATEMKEPVYNVVTVNEQHDVFNQMIAIIEKYTNKIESATSLKELTTYAAGLEEEVWDFQKKNAAAIKAFEASLSAEEKAEYEKKMMKAMEKMGQVVKQKMEELKK